MVTVVEVLDLSHNDLDVLPDLLFHSVPLLKVSLDGGGGVWEGGGEGRGWVGVGGGDCRGGAGPQSQRPGRSARPPLPQCAPSEGQSGGGGGGGVK